MKTHRWLSVTLVLVAGLTQVQCSPTPVYASSVSVKVVQSYDSLGFVVDWQAPVVGNSRQYPTAGYNVRVIEVLGDTLAATYTTATVDTLWAQMPPLGETLDYYAAVQTVDTQGQESETWALSDTETWITTSLAPNPPSGVNVDTVVGSLIIDSVVTITHADARTKSDLRDYILGFDSLPDWAPVDFMSDTLGYWFDAFSDTLRFGFVLYSGVAPVECCCQMITDPIGTHPCDAIALVSVQGQVPGSDRIEYRRAADFTANVDPSVSFGANMPAKGVMLLPEYQLQNRRTYAFLHRSDHLLPLLGG